MARVLIDALAELESWRSERSVSVSIMDDKLKQVSASLADMNRSMDGMSTGNRPELSPIQRVMQRLDEMQSSYRQKVEHEVGQLCRGSLLVAEAKASHRSMYNLRNVMFGAQSNDVVVLRRGLFSGDTLRVTHNGVTVRASEPLVPPLVTVTSSELDGTPTSAPSLFIASNVKRFVASHVTFEHRSVQTSGNACLIWGATAGSRASVEPQPVGDSDRTTANHFSSGDTEIDVSSSSHVDRCRSDSNGAILFEGCTFDSADGIAVSIVLPNFAKENAAAEDVASIIFRHCVIRSSGKSAASCAVRIRGGCASTPSQVDTSCSGNDYSSTSMLSHPSLRLVLEDCDIESCGDSVIQLERCSAEVSNVDGSFVPEVEVIVRSSRMVLNRSSTTATTGQLYGVALNDVVVRCVGDAKFDASVLTPLACSLSFITLAQGTSLTGYRVAAVMADSFAPIAARGTSPATTSSTLKRRVSAMNASRDKKIVMREEDALVLDATVALVPNAEADGKPLDVLLL